MLYLGRGGGCKCNYGCTADSVNDRPYPPVLRPEVMAPLRDAMRLVNSIKRDLDTLEEFDVLFLVRDSGAT